MKLVLVLVAAACAPSVGADCQDTWLEHGSAGLGLRVDYREGCYQGERLINFSRSSRQGLQWQSSEAIWHQVAFDDECSIGKVNEQGEVREFSCRASGSSPLAGAIYRYEEEQSTIECDGQVLPERRRFFVCVKGCRSDTPGRLDVVYGEGYS